MRRGVSVQRGRVHQAFQVSLLYQISPLNTTDTAWPSLYISCCPLARARGSAGGIQAPPPNEHFHPDPGRPSGPPGVEAGGPRFERGVGHLARHVESPECPPISSWLVQSMSECQ